MKQLGQGSTMQSHELVCGLHNKLKVVGLYLGNTQAEALNE
jgi:hypothetical protein